MPAEIKQLFPSNTHHCRGLRSCLSELHKRTAMLLGYYRINFEPIKMNVTFQETNENIN